jgi:hypothetical protein
MVVKCAVCDHHREERRAAWSERGLDLVTHPSILQYFLAS